MSRDGARKCAADAFEGYEPSELLKLARHQNSELRDLILMRLAERRSFKAIAKNMGWGIPKARSAFRKAVKDLIKFREHGNVKKSAIKPDRAQAIGGDTFSLEA